VAVRAVALQVVGLAQRLAASAIHLTLTYLLTTRNSAMMAAWLVVIE
jgi:hypothetical protein